MRRAWTGATVGIVIALTAVTVLALGFAAGVVVAGWQDDETPTKRPPAFSPGPVEGLLDLTDSGKERWSPVLEGRCNLDRLNVMVIADLPEGLDVVTVPGGCSTTRMLIGPEDGSMSYPPGI